MPVWTTIGTHNAWYQCPELWSIEAQTHASKKINKEPLPKSLISITLILLPNPILTHHQTMFTGYKMVLDRTFRNCWKCVPCVGNTYTENGNQSTCTECNSNSTFLWVNENKTTCDQPARSVDISTSAGKAIWFIASLNITILVFIIGKTINISFNR